LGKRNQTNRERKKNKREQKSGCGKKRGLHQVEPAGLLRKRKPRGKKGKRKGPPMGVKRVRRNDVEKSPEKRQQKRGLGLSKLPGERGIIIGDVIAGRENHQKKERKGSQTKREGNRIKRGPLRTHRLTQGPSLRRNAETPKKIKCREKKKGKTPTPARDPTISPNLSKTIKKGKGGDKNKVGK